MSNIAPHDHLYSIEPATHQDQVSIDNALPEDPSDALSQFLSLSDAQPLLEQPSGEAAGNAALTLAHEAWGNTQQNPLSRFHDGNLNFSFSIPTTHAFPGVQPDPFPGIQSQLLPQSNSFLTESCAFAGVDQRHGGNPDHFGAAGYGVTSGLGQDLSSSLWMSSQFSAICNPLDYPYPTPNNQLSGSFDFYTQAYTQPRIVKDSALPVALQEVDLFSHQAHGEDIGASRGAGSGQRAEPTTGTSKDEGESLVLPSRAEPAIVCFGMVVNPDRHTLEWTYFS